MIYKWILFTLSLTNLVTSYSYAEEFNQEMEDLFNTDYR